jgi:hypothetical protein
MITGDRIWCLVRLALPLGDRAGYSDDEGEHLMWGLGF